ncbi:hypothetical protein LK07_28725 [Streptomyces pluripotens]|uniref:ParB-like N-terminal domain-containing protein n=1 Tax=Streptomyces pluripotens TaxID=1355015 RepID=A0A221P5R7_9ACTN|nr:MULTISPECIES: ParB/RepB/Spo0J family partition protein [Streptomyces]ARP73107.1 hypothetical protein LK06_027555 [Streptomyces pluripotens]ASN27358.1 hypothetical protein LK07_28725 [Streptomyces pluripotens]MCH0558130.1 ParB-like nuclease domain-containing protein [Streptomyces sp. MUM 16J]
MTAPTPRTRTGLAEDRTERIAVSALMPADSPRAGEVDLSYARSLMALPELPPILVCRRTMRVIDGMHRLTAALLAGRAEIDVRYFDGDAEEAFIRAVQANLHHGRRLNQQERTAAARRILAAYPQWSNRSIAQAAGLSTKTVAAIRQSSSGDGPQLNTRVGRDGRARPVDPSAGRQRAAAYLRDHPDASLRQIASAAQVSVGTARDVRSKVQRGEDPIAPKDARGQARTVPLAAVAHAHSAPVPDRRRTAAADPLAALARDPSLRFSDPGRRLLRLLDNRALLGGDPKTLLAAVPRHSRAVLIAAVHQHVDLWLSFVSVLDQVS